MSGAVKLVALCLFIQEFVGWSRDDYYFNVFGCFLSPAEKCKTVPNIRL